MLVVVKRDGCRTAFDASRIKDAVVAAMDSAGQADHQYALELAETVQAQMADKAQVDIHELQDAVEVLLMSGPFKSVARHYIEYRHDRDKHREAQSKLNCAIRGLVEQSDSAILNENANKDAKVIPTQRDLLAGIVAKHYAKTHLLPKDVVAAHEKGEIHYHDLD
ncbi:MAG: anaerobic ribonucleoside-triphosphate reductase, partial [Shewanella sp.]